MKISNRIVTIHRTPIFFGKGSLSKVDHMVDSLHPSRCFIVVDSNTEKYCLPLLLKSTASLTGAQIIQTSGGEAAKSIENAERIWNVLLSARADRSSLVINLGGGVISDLGGFVAAGYQRGIRYINIPTSLMGQADAAIGGKTAVNLGNIKNQVGFFHPAEAIFIFPGFLETLPAEHLRSGMAEIIKSALISNASLWRRLHAKPLTTLLDHPLQNSFLMELIQAAITYKNRIVERDYREHKLRKVLNFGHTLGHTFESVSMTGNQKPLLHGEGVAAGMICAAYLSHLKAGLPEDDLREITAYLNDGFGRIHFDSKFQDQLAEFLTHDKKVKDGRIMFTLISKPGSPLVNVSCEMDEILDAINYYFNFSVESVV